MNKKVSYLPKIGLMTALILAGCSESEAENAGIDSDTSEKDSSVEQTYSPGSYEGVGEGMFGDVVLDVTFSEDEIVSIETLESEETPKVTTPTFEILPERIIEEQSLMVDTVSSATYTSHAILTAVEEAAEKASDDITSLKVELEKTPGEKIEKNTDVLVLGAGGAGLAAATSAAQEGAQVIVLEKNEWAGGNTVASGGGWNAPDIEMANQTPTKEGQISTLESYLEYDPEDYGEAADTLRTLQDQIEEYLSGDTSMMFDSEELFAFQTYIGGTREDLDGNEIKGDFELIKVLAENNVDTRNWIDELGANFADELGEPSGALWTRSLAPDSSDNPTEMIDSYVTNLGDIILENEGELIYGTPATELIIEDGVVKGAIGEMADGTEVEVKADSTIIATGGFASNLEMVKEYDNYWGNLGDSINYTTLPSTDGDGIIMGEDAGAQLVGMEATQLNKGYKTTGLHAAEHGLHGIFVNTDGKRFVNEYAPRDVYTKAAIDEGGEYFCIMNVENRLDTNGIYDSFVFDTVEEMAEHFDMDPEVLENEIDKYNSYVEAGEDPDFHKDVFGEKVTAPYLISAWVPIVHHTMGGLKINTDAAVLDENDEVIEGLFAAGEVTGGIHGGNRLGGNALADCFTFGKIAGKNAIESK